MNALVLVDIQNDFLPNGNLPIVKGDEVISIANKVIHQFDIVVATQDYHPANHKSFASQHQGKKAGDVIELNGLTQVLWPEHCVQGTKGAHFAEGLLINDSVKIFTKGTDPEIDSYSGFFDNGRRKATGLGDYLKKMNVDHVFILGLATDYCVKFTAVDAAELGFQTHLIVDGCRGVNLNPDDIDAAINEMRGNRIEVTNSDQVLLLDKQKN